MIEPTESQPPIEAIDSAEPMLATEPNDPKLPMDSTEPFEAIDSSESSDHSDHFDESRRRVIASASRVTPVVRAASCTARGPVDNFLAGTTARLRSDRYQLHHRVRPAPLSRLDLRWRTSTSPTSRWTTRPGVSSTGAPRSTA